MLIAGTQEFMLFTLIIMRMSGMIFLNPIFGRTNIPNYFKIGLSLLLAVIVFPMVPVGEIQAHTSIMYGVLLLKEFIVGFLIGMVMRIFEMVAIYAGTIIDFQMGLAMASVYDAQSGGQIALTGNILQIYFLLLFFAVDGHLAIFKILMTSHEVIPYASVTLGTGAVDAILVIFLECVALAVKLAFPLIAFEFIMEIAIGLLMKMIPQINLFIMSIQLRVIMGIVMLIFLMTPIGDYLENVVTEMVGAVQEVLTTIS